MKWLDRMSKSNKIIVILILSVVAMMLLVSYHSLASNNKDFNDSNGWTLNVYNGSTSNPFNTNNNDSSLVYVDYNSVMVDMYELFKDIGIVYNKTLTINDSNRTNPATYQRVVNVISILKYNEKYPSATTKTNKGIRLYDDGTYDKVTIDDNKTIYVPDRYNYYYDETNYVSVDDSVTLDIESKDDNYYLPLYFFANIPGISISVDGNKVYDKTSYHNSIEAIDRTKAAHVIDIRINQKTPNYNDVHIANSTGDYYGKSNGSLWREEALKRIEKYRKNDLDISVVDKNDNPIEGASINIKMKSNPFLFGTMLSYDKDGTSGHNNYGVSGNTYDNSSTTFDSSSLLTNSGINKQLFNSAGVNNIFSISEGNNNSYSITEALRKDSINTLRNIDINNVRGSYIYDNGINDINLAIIGNGTNRDLSDNNITLSAIYNQVSEWISENTLTQHQTDLNNYKNKAISRYESLYYNYIDYLMGNPLYKNVNSYDVLNNIGSFTRIYVLLYKGNFLSIENFWESSVYNNINATLEDSDALKEEYVNFLKNIIKRVKDTRFYEGEIVFSEGSNKGTWIFNDQNTSVTELTQNIIDLIKAIDTKYYESGTYTNSIISSYGLKYKPSSNYSTPQSYYNELNNILNNTKIKNGKIVEYDNSNGISKEEYLRDSLIMAYSNKLVNEFNFYNYYDDSITNTLERNIYSKFIKGDYFYDKKDLLSYDGDFTSNQSGDASTRLYKGVYEVTVTFQTEVVKRTITLDNDKQESIELDITGFDLIKPTVEDFTVSKDGFNSKVDFKCSDNAGVKGWFFGSNDSEFTQVEPAVSLFTVPTISINTEGTYYYGCIDKSNNKSIIGSIEFNKVVINSNLLTLTGTKGVYNSTNYEQVSTHNLIRKKGNTIDDFGDLYTPTGAGEYKGYIPADSTSITDSLYTINSNTVVNTYFDRIEYNITAVCKEGVSSVKLTNNASNGSVTSTMDDNRKVLTIRSGTEVSVTATLGSGSTFNKWSGMTDSTENPVTFTPRASGSVEPLVTIEQNEKPTSEFENVSNELKANNVSLTLKCSDDNSVSSYYFGTTLNPGDTLFTSIDNSSTTFSKSQSISSAGTYYLVCRDNKGEKSVASMITVNKYTVNKMLLNEGGNKGVYSTSNYTQVESNDYLGTSSLLLTMSILKDSLPDNASSYLGYTIGSASSLSTDNPTNSINNAIYNLWYDRVSSTPTISNPVAELKSLTNNVSVKTQSVTLKCSSSEKITKYYVGTNNNPQDINYKNVSSSNSSVEVKINIESAGNYYFGCMSERGLKSTLVNQEYTSYTIKEELLNITGKKGTYDSSNYKEVLSDSYIIPKGSTLVLGSINAPTGASASTFKGYTLGNNTLLTDNVVVNENKTITMWYDRDEYTITLVATSLVPKITAKNENNQVVTATLEDNNKELVSRYGESVVVTATSSDGKAINWGNISNSSDDTITFNANRNLVIKLEESSSNEVNPKTGSITNYIKYVLLISLVMFIILFKFVKGLYLD